MSNLIFKPTKKGLLKAQKKRLDRWNEIDNQQYTKEQIQERIDLEIEVFDSMSIVRNRAMELV